MKVLHMNMCSFTPIYNSVRLVLPIVDYPQIKPNNQKTEMIEDPFRFSYCIRN